jgi:hypothetical protein
MMHALNMEASDYSSWGRFRFFAACRIGLAPRPERWCVAPPDRFTSDAFNLMEACAALTPPDDGVSAYNIVNMLPSDPHSNFMVITHRSQRKPPFVLPWMI